MSNSSTCLILPNMKEKWPDKTDFLTGFEIEPSNKIIIAKIKKVSKSNSTPIFDSCG